MPLPLFLAGGGAFLILSLVSIENLSGQNLLRAFRFPIATLAVIIICLLAWIWYTKYREVRYQRSLKMSGIDLMSGVGLEHYIAWLLKERGFKNVQDFGVITKGA